MSKIIDELKKAGVRGISIRIRPKEEDKILFPSLEELAKEFYERNHLSGMSVTPYSFPRDNGSYETRGGISSDGLVLDCNQGIVVLTKKSTGGILSSRDGKLEPTFGGRPIKQWRREYLLAGELNKEQVGMQADIVYSQKTRQTSVECQLTHTKHFEDVAFGRIHKQIFRGDNCQFWFLTKPNSLGPYKLH